MKRLFALLSLTLSMTALASNPYVGANITRTYYQSELESCPGVLDMQPGDLWTLTFPDNITDSFLTRDGLVERKVQDNRVVMAVTATSGTSPMLVMTEDGHAPRFMITIQGGAGGRNKNVIIKPGWGSSSACAGARPVTPATSAAPVTPTLIRVSVPQASPAPSKSAARPPLPSATPLPTKAVKVPTPPLTARKPFPSNPTAVKSLSPQPGSAATFTPTATPHAQTPIPVTVNTPAAPRPTVTLDAPTATTPATPSTPTPLPGRASAVLASGPTYLTATVVPEAQGRLLSIRITSRLDADVMLDEQDLTVGDATSTSRRQVMVPAGQDITLTLRLQGSLPKRQGRLLWTGSVLGSGETFLISATLPLPA